MIGNLSEDYLNYPLIMEGFYYDAEIEHIVEIAKNNIYFAVLEGENKIIKNTLDTYYFNIDDELVYTNYYFDFGPLNISCVYKYCCKLNGYLQYSQGLKRIVHYTTSNPVKRVNAAFLMGCYAIIYLKMQAKDIYRILLSAGGQFKSFVDASQGISQYTIRLLDCFHAIQKVISFNFFNFTDFNVIEYDMHDVLQNGDMNWLVPRKFLAFVGPTENQLMNGHPPDFYIKYFLDNDIKTVIRLNNKMYDASTFVRAGIDHHDLFFPDGTVPTKQILLRFLDLAESARAAIGVHCKAGLGRTGSLIGAYIIKHYRMPAREAIAWMRICRPGSVIGQQQGWLEKIESWLWRQGSQYRLHHFGEGDKIPHHKYGIYSKEWPKEREKLIKHVKRRRLQTQANSSRGRHEIKNTMRITNSLPAPADCLGCNSAKSKKSSGKNNYDQKLGMATEKDEEYRKVSKMINRLQKNRDSKTSSEGREMYRIQNVNKDNLQYEHDVPSMRMNTKRLASNSKYKEKLDSADAAQQTRSNDLKSKRYLNTAPPYEFYDAEAHGKLDFSDDFHEAKSTQAKGRRRNQSESREQLTENRLSGRIRRHFVDNLEQTQGDKLVEIKARRVGNHAESEDKGNVKQTKQRQRLSNVTNVNVYNKSKASTSKKDETLSSPKRSHFEQYYPSRT